jgi:cold shock CspA family protein
MQVDKYLPDKLYGFTAKEGEQIYFHVAVFDTAGWPDAPPIVGEAVEVEFDPSTAREGKVARATRVIRVREPMLCRGVVDSFDAAQGWGFIVPGDGSPHVFLHRSEVLNRRLPLKGQTVRYYTGLRDGRARAVYVEIEDRP